MSFSSICKLRNGGELAQGGSPSEDDARGFDVVVLCAQEEPRTSLGQNLGRARLMRAPMGDTLTPSQKEVQTALSAAKHVAKSLSRGKKVLVTCHMGWNRSGLVNGLSLVKLGVPASEAIRLIKRARGPGALSNTTFLKLVSRYGSMRLKKAS